MLPAVSHVTGSHEGGIIELPPDMGVESGLAHEDDGRIIIGDRALCVFVRRSAIGIRDHTIIGGHSPFDRDTGCAHAGPAALVGRQPVPRSGAGLHHVTAPQLRGLVAVDRMTGDRVVVSR